MIYISHPLFEKRLSIGKDYFYHIVIENCVAYRNFLTELEKQVLGLSESFGVKEKEKNVELSKIAVFVKTPLFWEIDEKKVSTTVQKDIASKLSENDIQRYRNILDEINEWINSIGVDYDVPVTCDTDIPVASFLKTFSVTSSSQTNDYVELFVNQVKKVAMVLRKKLFFVMNAHDIFDSGEIETIFQELNRHEISILFLSAHAPKRFSSSEKIILIDNDLAELHLHTDEIE